MAIDKIQEKKEDIHIDTNLNFSKQFSFDDTVENGFTDSNIIRKIHSLIADGDYFGFRFVKNGNKLQLTPIYKDIDSITIEKLNSRKYTDNIDFVYIVGNLEEGKCLFFKFESDNSIERAMENTEDRVTKIIT